MLASWAKDPAQGNLRCQMKFHVGLDVGSISAKLAAFAAPEFSAELERPFVRSSDFWLATSPLAGRPGRAIVLSKYERAHGSPLDAALSLIEKFRECVPEGSIAGIRVTGSGGRRAAQMLLAEHENEFRAIARGVSALYPQLRTIFEMGGESSKYLLLESTASGAAETLGIADYSASGECAAGTGSFIDQQATRLRYQVEEIGAVVAQAKTAARIAGRCSVFAKSDMIHAQQKGYGTGEVLKGLCEAVARNFKSNIVKGRKIAAPVAFIGGVSQNAGVAAAIAEAFHLAPGDLFVPELYAWLGALGAALLGADEDAEGAWARAQKSQAIPPSSELASERRSPNEPLSLANVLLLRDHPDATRSAPLPEARAARLPVYLGIDVGSVSTNLAVLDEDGRLLHGIYLRTAGRPVDVVNEGLAEIERLFGSRIEIRGAGTTGSGRELIGELVGADTVNDEITAHKTGAMYVHETLVKRMGAAGEVDTIFEIGGQDSKFISIDRGVVVDFAMNEACAAGTGSFLEEQAERLGIQIKDEFARRALGSKTPARLGERCTVFMERDVTSALGQGARVEDLTAGLAYSVALNYLNRVVRGRKIGDVIYFQGGTAYNDAVAAAFSTLIGKTIIVPPHNGIIGAIGMALIAQQVTRVHRRARSRPAGVASAARTPGSAALSAFRGFDLNATRFETREFVCKACSNYCDMKEITVEGRKSYWGDKCSDKFRKRARTDRQPVIEDLLAFREAALLDGFAAERGSIAGNGHGRRGRVGIPRAMFFHDQFPFWRTYLETMGFRVVLSPPTDRYLAARGTELSVAEPCFPAQIAHGHVQALLDGKMNGDAPDFVLLPNVMDRESPGSETASYLCPWNQTLPFVVRAAPELSGHAERILAPTVHFRPGRRYAARELSDYFGRFGVKRRESDAATEAAFLAQEKFEARLKEAGKAACAKLAETGEPAVLLVGRAYNLYDRNSNCDIPRKLRDLYGVNVLPLDFLPLDEIPPAELHPNMYWNSGRRILAAGRFARNHPGTHLIYVTNFKCGPDSFIKHFLRDVAGAPFLVLQFDGHGNDAGYLTRCEAYLDSKGILRCAS